MPASSSGGSEQSGPHERQFIDCIRTREQPISDIETTHHSTATCLMANIALKTGEKLKWDAENQRFSNSEEANRMLDYTHTEPWRV